MSEINDYKPGMIVYGRVSGIKPYGAFVSFSDGVTGLIHISELSSGFVRNVANFVNVNDYIMVKVIDVDYKHRHLRLSFKALHPNGRKARKRVHFEGLPSDEIGFRSLSEALPKWILEGEKRNDES